MISYGDDPQYYKQLIAQINAKVNFPMYLQQQGYTLIKKSAGWMEFRNDKDKIVLNTSRMPVTYFNRSDSLDKGLFFKYIFRREQNFYKAVQKGLSISNQSFDELNLNQESNRVKKISKPLESNYNIGPIQNSEYLTSSRGISKTTVEDPKFKGRIFNAYHISDNGGKIPNTAFPKYDLEGVIKNYVLYNRPYRSRVDQKIKKFRLVLNKKDHFLFYSSPVKGKNIRVVIGESVPDVLAYHEMHGKAENLYISFEGNLYPEKLEFFVALFQKITQDKNVAVVSIMDHDARGFEFDIKAFSSLINASSSEVCLESRIQNGKVSLTFHYVEKVTVKIENHRQLLNKVLGSREFKNSIGNRLVKCIGFSDKLLVEFQLPELIKGYDLGIRNRAFELLWSQISKIYLPYPTTIEKSVFKDWNEDLQLSKKPKMLAFPFTDKSSLSKGDIIALKTAQGPEGSSNKGRLIEIRDHSVLCDFGLSYEYAIPYQNIKTVFRPQSKVHHYNEGIELKKTQKNNNLQNNIL